MLARVWNAAVVVLVVAGLVIQIAITVRVHARPPSHGVGQLAGAPLGGRLLRVISFFTIQSNILSAVTAAQLAREPERDGAAWRVVRLAALFGITVTGIVYTTVLARTHEPRGWQQVSSNAIFHYVVPIMMVLAWLLFGPRPRVTMSTVWCSLAWPVLYFAYTLVRGAVGGWYPYPFVDAHTQGYPRVLLNAVLVTLVLGAVAALYGLGDRRLPGAPRPATSAARTG